MSSSSSFSCGTPMRRAETGSFPGLAPVFLFFTAFGGTTFASPTGGESWLNVAVQLGIVVIPIGSIVPAGSLTCVIISGHFGLPIGFGVGAALALGFSVLVTGATSVAIIVPQAKWLPGDFIGGIYQVTIFWWIAAILFWGLFRHFSRFGIWIFAMGGAKVSARNASIPTCRVTIMLFVCSGMCAALVGLSQPILSCSAQLSAGQSYVLNQVNSVVVGDVLLLGAVLMNNTFREMALSYAPKKGAK